MDGASARPEGRARAAVVGSRRCGSALRANRQNPSVIPLRDLAILNQVEDGASILPAGQWKRVVAE